MDQEDSEIPHRSSFFLFELLQVGNHMRTISEGRRFLESRPEDRNAHFCIAMAQIELERPRDAKAHVDFLISQFPEDTNSHLAVISLAKSRKNWQLVRKHSAEGSRLDPDDSVFYFFAAIADMAEMKFAAAREHIDRALELDPNDVDYLNLSVRLSAVNETSAEDAWKRIGELRNALKHDPSNAGLHDSLGDIFLDDLDAPAEAEHHYRQALSAEPGNRNYQLALFQAVAKRDLVYRLFSLPSRSFAWLGYLCYALRFQPWRMIFLLIGFQFVIAYFVWLAVVTIVLWPAGKVYEWLLVTELKAGAAVSEGNLKAWYLFQRLPRLIRLGAFLAGFAGAYAGIFLALDISMVLGFSMLGAIVGIHFAIIVIHWLFKRSERLIGKAKQRKRPPPLPYRT